MTTAQQQAAIDAIVALDSSAVVHLPRTAGEGAAVSYATGDRLGIPADGYVLHVQFASYAADGGRFIRKAIRVGRAAAKAVR